MAGRLDRWGRTCNRGTSDVCRRSTIYPTRRRHHSSRWVRLAFRALGERVKRWDASSKVEWHKMIGQHLERRPSQSAGRLHSETSDEHNSYALKSNLRSLLSVYSLQSFAHCACMSHLLVNQTSFSLGCVAYLPRCSYPGLSRTTRILSQEAMRSWQLTQFLSLLLFLSCPSGFTPASGSKDGLARTMRS